MKKKMAMGLLLLTMFVLTLTACGSKKDGETKDTTGSTTSSETTKATEPVTSSAQETDTALAQPEESSSVGASLTLQGVRDAVAEAYGENYLPSMPLDGESLAQMYGVTEDMYEEAFGEVPMISAQVSSVGGVGLESVPQTVMPRARAAARSMDALRMPLVTSSFNRGNRSSKAAGKGVRSRMMTRISASVRRATRASRSGICSVTVPTATRPARRVHSASPSAAFW